MRRSIVKTSIAALLAFGSLGVDAALSATRGGKMVYARYADSLFLDPVMTDANVDIWVMTNLYDTLIAPTNDGMGVQPSLATKWETSADGKTVTLTVRTDVKFSDGTPMTPADVKF
jgi:peptide/nickel transport system substrate-binding protein